MIPKTITLNRETFNDRIMGMMADYEIPMSKALFWDFESFGFTAEIIYAKHGMKGLENRFRTYLVRNGIIDSNSFYTDIFLGRDSDRILRRKDDAESEDQSSGETKSGSEGA